MHKLIHSGGLFSDDTFFRFLNNKICIFVLGAYQVSPIYRMSHVLHTMYHRDSESYNTSYNIIHTTTGRTSVHGDLRNVHHIILLLAVFVCKYIPRIRMRAYITYGSSPFSHE